MKDNNENKVKRGERMNIPAATWNNVVDAAKAEKRSRFNPENAANSGIPTALTQSNLTTTIKNNSSYDLPVSYQILAIDGILTSADDIQQSIRFSFQGIQPDNKNNAFAVVSGPLGIEDIGKAITKGLAFTRVKITNPDHEFCNPTPGTSGWLTSDETGQARILYYTPTGDAEELSNNIYFAVIDILGLVPSGGSSDPVYADVIGPAASEEGQLAFFTDSSGRIIGNAKCLKYVEVNNPIGGLIDFRSRSTLSIGFPLDDFPSNPRSEDFTTFGHGGFQYELISNLPFNPLSGIIPTTGTAYTPHTVATKSIFHRVVGSTNENVINDYVIDMFYLREDGGLCTFLKQWTFVGINNTCTDAVYYDSVKLEYVRTFSGQFWMRHYAFDGTPGLSVGTGSSGSFANGLLVYQHAAITPLGSSPTSSDIATKTNEIIAAIKSLGLTL